MALGTCDISSNLAACVEFAVAEKELHVLQTSLGGGRVCQLGLEQLVNQLLSVSSIKSFRADLENKATILDPCYNFPPHLPSRHLHELPDPIRCLPAQALLLHHLPSHLLPGALQDIR